MINKLIDQIKRDEGVSYTPYQCTAGKTTIGVGRNLDDVGLDDEEVAFLLVRDIKRCKKEIDDRLPWVGLMNAPREAAIINMVFNLGITRFMRFVNTIEACAKGDYKLAAKEMLNSQWANQVGNRAERLALQMETGQWVD